MRTILMTCLDNEGTGREKEEQTYIWRPFVPQHRLFVRSSIRDMPDISAADHGALSWLESARPKRPTMSSDYPAQWSWLAGGAAWFPDHQGTTWGLLAGCHSAIRISLSPWRLSRRWRCCPAAHADRPALALVSVEPLWMEQNHHVNAVAVIN